MATIAQTEANRANAQKSSGPKTEAGKAISSQNNFKHGFTGGFSILPTEEPRAYQQLLDEFQVDHLPAGKTEEILVELMAQHHWLRARAIQLQNVTLALPAENAKDNDRQFALYLRYQTTNERASLQVPEGPANPKNRKKKGANWVRIAKACTGRSCRKHSIEKRKQDMHQIDLWIAETKAERTQAA